ncbi:biotin--[acetyl-CoA-carboxylase] ligase [Legionella pneumophila]|uniref:biotin--[acetyl-CoA-carboxylase] ligase n=1 Tax=Legionella pneumophila TaxID=446 RepID=UPI00077802DF|nr:biotin--[acetyl-CoA-carboxylase] ligase [Legionella pneumophila]MCW8427780.1 biotin--[acetyl-CoA-carboxylase] ligase [Legionella pneumophila]HAT1820620.1 biotin--[acetyl-CoA-carboxylase] ligase [Legionella pneumophila]HAT6809152.1 biotin--[acetyl-CoA-carboxylase] ligase [Legionella pneumophila]HAT8670069.1 biotin--[acetyl-CoA-carboxylase] ligase [Legionella pneumophila]HAU1606025.1 biotin--[acetyl-CoA-carboxylase] ligase [Legionella pneumophila]
MFQFNPSQHTLMQILGDGICHSGSELGNALKISRSAVWKQINQLNDLGIPIIRLAHQGYQLAKPLILLESDEITRQLHSQGFGQPFKLHLFTSIDSTNRYLKDLPSSSAVEICCTEIQTQGRGRFGRHWHSPFGENIYCSTRWSFNCDLSRLSGLSLVSSLALVAFLNTLSNSKDIKIKWPNDILWGNKKLCGSLIEIMAESNSSAQVIIGIGLNVNTDTEHHPLPDKPWCSLYEIYKQQYNRNFLIASLIVHLEQYLNKFMNADLDIFMSEWNAVDYLAGKYITVSQSSGLLSGIACGVNPSGQLMLKDDKGICHYLSSGDTSLQTGKSQ